MDALGALSSLLRHWLTFFLHLCQAAGEILRYSAVVIFKLALTNQEKRWRWAPFRKQMKGTRQRSPVMLPSKVWPKPVLVFHPPRGEASPGRIGKRKGRQSTCPEIVLEPLQPKRVRKSLRVLWRFYLPSPEEADLDSQDVQNVGNQNKESKAAGDKLDLNPDDPCLELRSRNGASSDLRPRTEARSTWMCGGISAQILCDRRLELRPRNGASSDLRPRGEARSTWMSGGIAAQVFCDRRRPPLMRRKLGDSRPTLCPKHSRPGLTTGNRSFSGFALSSARNNGCGDNEIRCIFMRLRISPNRLLNLNLRSSPLQIEFPLQWGLLAPPAYLRRPATPTPIPHHFRQDGWVHSSGAQLSTREKYSGRWLFLCSDILLSLWDDVNPLRNIHFKFSCYPWNPVGHDSDVIFLENLSSPPMLQMSSMAHISRDQVVEFTLTEIQANRASKSRMLLGRVFSEDRLTLTELREATNNPWQGQGRIRVREAAHGLYEFVLPTEAAKNWVLQRTPWVIKDRILHLRAWTPNISARTVEEMAIAPFRVQMWDVQEECCTQQFGRKVANSTIGRVLESGIFSCTESASTFIKVKALIDFSKPLRSQIWASNEETGSFWIRFKYEHLPSFCYNCGRVGHFRQKCTFDPPSRKERFGPHMMTKKMGRKIFDAEEPDQRFPGHHNSVWINSTARNKQDPEKRMDNREDGVARRAPVPNKKMVVDSSPLWMGSSDNPFAATEPDAPRGKPGRSPLRFPVQKAPKIPIGKAARRGRGQAVPVGSPMEIDVRQEVISAPRRRGRQGKPGRDAKEADPTIGLKAGGTKATSRGGVPAFEQSPRPEAQGMTRRRRLLIEEESEDEFSVQPISLNGQGGKRNPPLQAEPRKARVLKGKETVGPARPGPKRGNVSAQSTQALKPEASSIRKIEKACSGKCLRRPKGETWIADQTHGGSLVDDPAQDGNGAEQAEVGRPPSPRTAPLADPLGSEDTLTDDEEEAQAFEIRRRIPSASGVLKRG
ncbi:unnamed protein product [Linum tenue]|uniref:CCHC-type domain-containing protein n=1 Tax=Linum tenue TaxID=586396 RepID=A0AAV0PFG6_9ROSI|nr:unnamed protein product [Linum tenue]